MKLKILSVVAARPNFMKIAPFIRAINDHNAEQRSKEPETDSVVIDHVLVHTGQHYDQDMSAEFIRELNIPEPDINLGVGSGTHAEQVGQTMIEFEKVLRKIKPDWVVVVGDVNATMACAVTAKKEQIKCCHIEAGLRSRDMTMPEEINRIIADRMSDLLFTPDRHASQNLINEGFPEDMIKMVGNIMVDTLKQYHSKALELDLDDIITQKIFPGQNYNIKCSLKNQPFMLMTLHRPSNVDNRQILTPIIELLLDENALKIPIIWPIHPRTQSQLVEFRLWDKLLRSKNIYALRPIGYLELLRFNHASKIILTDSGGLQVESSVIGKPCIVVRENTEWLISLEENGGTCILAGNNPEIIYDKFNRVINSKREVQSHSYNDNNTSIMCISALIEASK